MTTPSQQTQPSHSSHLNTGETTQPYKVLDTFFDFATLPEAHACLDQWLLAAFRAQDGEELNYLHLYRHLSRLVEACWLLHRQYTALNLV